MKTAASSTMYGGPVLPRAFWKQRGAHCSISRLEANFGNQIGESRGIVQRQLLPKLSVDFLARELGAASLSTFQEYTQLYPEAQGGRGMTWPASLLKKTAVVAVESGRSLTNMSRRQKHKVWAK